MSNNQVVIEAITSALSRSRMSTFEAGAKPKDAQDMASLQLYAWNAAISGALLPVLHVCEVVVRNAVSDALEALYGPKWAWSDSFEQSLPRPPQGYCQHKDLLDARKGAETIGKVIPELKFAFWQRMFTKRHDGRLWNRYLRDVLPNLDKEMPVKVHRDTIFNHLDNIRLLRNRIAHHEPIFNRNLTEDYAKIMSLIHYRCNFTAMWLSQSQIVSTTIKAKP
ncbi:hypothetical protein [Burkholderia sp. 22313]|uniref:hypothetical protein n=1 Tax=Burkholderia sp. 22313 TaxID=3453908 RepID=UPI002B805D81|nr:hypothetical protein [Burkholderia sp.]